MKLADATWPEIAGFQRGGVVLIPTGSCEQHGPHLPLFTDSILVTAVAERLEEALPQHVVLTPTLWLGASGHHLAFEGTLSASMSSYLGSVESVIRSLMRHGFWKFYVLNGHGGNTSPNEVALRMLKEAHPNLVLGARGYFEFIGEGLSVLESQATIRHACEAEVSLMLHVAPSLVRWDRVRDDGLEPNVPGLVLGFEEKTEEGSLGIATAATAEKGRVLFDAAVAGATEAIRTLVEGVELRG